MSPDARSTLPGEPVPVIENELPTYRAISAPAIASLVLGLASVFSFADRWFLLLGAAAIAAGVAADRRIRRYDDVLTGRGLAHLGIALGLVFSLSSLTIGFVQGLALKRSASAFGAGYAKVLQGGSMAEVAYYRFRPSQRQGKTAQELLDEALKGATTDPGGLDQYLGSLRAVQERASRPGQTVKFEGLEQYGYDRLTPLAAAVFELEGPVEGKGDQHDLALLVLKSEENQPGFSWYIDDVKYPYRRKTYVTPETAADDGHGH